MFYGKFRNRASRVYFIMNDDQTESKRKKLEADEGGYWSLHKLGSVNDGAARVNEDSDFFPSPNDSEAEEGEDELDEAGKTISLPSPLSFLASPAILSVLVIVVSLTVFFIVGQAIQLLSLIDGLPGVFRWIGMGGVWLLLAACMLAFLYLIYTLLRFKTAPQITLPNSDFIELKHTRRTLHKCQALKSRMAEYLKNYPVDTDKDYRNLKKLGMASEDIQSLSKAKERVLQYHKSSEQDWLKRFDAEFLSRLDAFAERRINRYSVDTGVKTAVFPVNFINAAVVLINSFMMVTDLCRVYRLRSSLGFTAVIFGWSFFHTLAAARLGEMTEEGAEYLMEAISPELECGAVNFLGKRFAPKLTEGVINGLVIRMLGRQTMKRLKPLHVLRN